MESFIAVIFIGVIIYILFFVNKNKNNQNNLKKTEQTKINTQAMDALQIYLQRNRLPIYQGQLPILLKDDEYPIACSNANIAEERSTSHYNGMSFRVVSGMYYRTGQSNSESQLTVIDNGLLILTIRRLVFIGNKRSSTTDLSKIVGLELFNNAFTISKQSKSKTETYFVDAPSIYKLIIELLNKHHFVKEDNTTLIINNSYK